jgi:hypothetical protein
VGGLIEGVKGRELKNKAMEWKILAEEATGTCSSSFIHEFTQVVERGAFVIKSNNSMFMCGYRNYHYFSLKNL